MKRTPLYGKHISLKAKMVDFSGWEMPVYYSGIIEEHLHTRSAAGIFDICHMGEFFFDGPDAAREVDKLVTCRVDDMPTGKCRYGFFLSRQGGIIDDLIVFRISKNEFMIVVNAGTIEKDRDWVSRNISGDVAFSDRSEDIAKIDIQGPLSWEIMGELAGKDIVGKISRYSFVKTSIKGVEVILARTGYTGEIGYELFFGREHSEMLWDLFMGFDTVKPVGLGARDTLRLEMGYPLYGSDISEDVNPFEAGFGRFVYMEKDFIGKEALITGPDKKNEKILSGFECAGRRIARHGFNVEIDGKLSGVVTSGAFSPCLKKAIGLCYVKQSDFEPQRGIVLTDGSVSIEAKLSKVPLLKR